MKFLFLTLVFVSAALASESVVSIDEVRARKNELLGQRVCVTGFLWVHPEEVLLLAAPPPRDTEPDFRRSLYFVYSKMSDSESRSLLKSLLARGRRGESLPALRVCGVIVEAMFGHHAQKKALGVEVELVSIEEKANQPPQRNAGSGSSSNDSSVSETLSSLGPRG